MRELKRSGNSYTEIIKVGECFVFRKHFSDARPIQYFTEYFNNRYLRQIDTSLAAEIFRFDHKRLVIDYKVYKSAPQNWIYAEKYKQLIERIHRSTSDTRNHTKLLASQPMVNIQSFTNTFQQRIDEFKKMKVENETKVMGQ